MHNGTVKAQSEGVGRGAIFTVELPIVAVRAPNLDSADGSQEPADGSADASKANLSEPSVRLDGLRIVIVDDEVDARRVVARVLQGAGATVTAADSVSEALRAVEEVQPHLLVSDIAMPDEDGYDLIRKVRAKGHGVQSLPAVALTAYAAKSYTRTMLLAGFQMHLSKPVDPHDLIAAVASLTGRTGS